MRASAPTRARGGGRGERAVEKANEKGERFLRKVHLFAERVRLFLSYVVRKLIFLPR